MKYSSCDCLIKIVLRELIMSYLWLSWETIWILPETGGLLQFRLMIWIQETVVHWPTRFCSSLHQLLLSAVWHFQPSAGGGGGVTLLRLCFWHNHVLCLDQWDVSRQGPNRGLNVCVGGWACPLGVAIPLRRTCSGWLVGCRRRGLVWSRPVPACSMTPSLEWINKQTQKKA